MSDFTEINEFAAPITGQLTHAVKLTQGIVAARCDDAPKRQPNSRHRQPPTGLQLVDRWIARGHSPLEVWRSGEQRAVNSALRLCCPVGYHDNAPAVRDQEHGPLDRVCFAFDCRHPSGAVQVLASHWVNHANAR